MFVQPRGQFVCDIMEKRSLSRSQRNALLNVADKLSPVIRAKFLKAFAELKSRVRYDKLVKAIQERNEQAIFQALGLNDLAGRLGPLTDESTRGFIAAGSATATQIADGVVGPRIIARFDAMNPRSARAISNYNLNLITRITNEQKDSIRQILMGTLGGSGSPGSVTRNIADVLSDEEKAYRVARQMKGLLGLTPRYAQAVQNFRRKLEEGSMTAASGHTISGNTERSIRAAFRDGKSLGAARINQMVEEYADRLLRQRAGVIAHTEAMRAVNIGQREAWNQTLENSKVDRKNVRRFWVATNDEHTRDTHRQIVEFNPDGVGMDEPFLLPDGRTIMYPGDENADPDLTINCRCTIVVRLNEIPEELLPPVQAGRSIL